MELAEFWYCPNQMFVSDVLLATAGASTIANNQWQMQKQQLRHLTKLFAGNCNKIFLCLVFRQITTNQSWAGVTREWDATIIGKWYQDKWHYWDIEILHRTHRRTHIINIICIASFFGSIYLLFISHKCFYMTLNITIITWWSLSGFIWELNKWEKAECIYLTKV